jgi:small subunit ribosomal protein S5
MAERKEKAKNFVDFVINVARVTKVTKGGKQFSFSALVVTGDQEGNVGIGLGKSKEVSLAIAKATNQARKKLIPVALRGTTIPYDVVGKHGASRVVVRPAYKGTGVIAGGPVRKIMEAVGIKDILAKSLGSTNPQNVVKATLNAFAQLRSAQELARQRGITLQQAGANL